jgi:hypothetical protein
MDKNIDSILYSKYNNNYSYSEVLKGWSKLVYDMYSELDEYFVEGLTIHGIKTKNGLLSVDYLYGIDMPYTERQKINNIISKYENESKKICELCSTEENVNIKVIRNSKFRKTAFTVCECCENKMRYP